MKDSTPLAEKIRPKNLSQFIGQKHLAGKDKPVRLSIEKKTDIFHDFLGSARQRQDHPSSDYCQGN